MEGRELAEFKNKILKELLTQTEEIRIIRLYASLGRPLKSIGHFELLIDRIKEEFPKYIGVRDFFPEDEHHPEKHIRATKYTRVFLENGGFVNQYDSDLEADRETEKLAERDERMDLWEERKLKYWWVPIALSIIGVGIAIASYFRPSDNITGAEIETIQQNIRTMKQDFKKENEELRERVQEAEMLKLFMRAIRCRS